MKQKTVNKRLYNIGTKISCCIDMDDVTRSVYTGTIVNFGYWNNDNEFEATVDRDDGGGGSGFRNGWIIRITSMNSDNISIIHPPEWDNDENDN